MEELAVGNEVVLLKDETQKGKVRFIGPTEFASGEWIGVELYEPNGKNDGAVKGKQYFQCENNHGLFVRKNAVRLVSNVATSAETSESNSQQEQLTSTSIQESNSEISQPLASTSEEKKTEESPIEQDSPPAEIKPTDNIESTEKSQQTHAEEQKTDEQPKVEEKPQEASPVIEQSPKVVESPRTSEQTTSIENSILEDISTDKKVEPPKPTQENIVEKILENIDSSQNLSLTTEEPKESEKDSEENVQLNEDTNKSTTQPVTLGNPVIGVSPSEVAISPLDVEFLESIERNANDCAHNLVKLSGILRNSVQKTSSLSLQYMEAYKLSADNSTEAVAQSIADMNNLITKCKELNEELKPVETLAAQISDIKKNLDYFEILVARMTK